MDEFDDAAAEIIDALGRDFVYFDQVDLHDVTGIWSNSGQQVEGTRGPAVNSRRPELTILSTSFTARQGDLVFRGKRADFRGDFDYEVVSTRPDEEETSVTLILKALKKH